MPTTTTPPGPPETAAAVPAPLGSGSPASPATDSAADSAATAPRLPFSLFLGLRYLRPRRTFVSIITLIAVLGVALGVAMPIIVISVMTGYDSELHERVLGFEPHLAVVQDQGLIADWRTVRQEILKTPGVTAAAPFMMGPVLAEHANKRISPKVRGIDPELEATVIDIPSLMKDPDCGKFDLDGDKAVVGVDLAKILDLHVGDPLTLYSPKNLESLADRLKELKGRPATEQEIEDMRSLVEPTVVTVTGIFNSGRYQYDSDILFVPLHLGQELYELEGAVHGVSAKTNDPYHADRIKAEAAKHLDKGLVVQTWIDLNAQFFNAVRTERTVMWVILLVVFVVAGFCVMNTLITVTVQKTREIGIMRAVGSTEGQVIRVFMYQGMVIGVLGTIGGLALGLGVLRLLNPFKFWMDRQFNVELFPHQVYGFQAIPYLSRPLDLTLICVGAFLTCSMAALIPAYLAARRDPVKALRSE